MKYIRVVVVSTDLFARDAQKFRESCKDLFKGFFIQSLKMRPNIAHYRSPLFRVIRLQAPGEDDIQSHSALIKCEDLLGAIPPFTPW